MISTQRIDTHILWAEIDRPKAHNAINFQTIDHLEQLVEKIEKDKDLRVFILSGAGSQSFVAGGDLKEFHTITNKDEASKLSLRMQILFERIELLPCWNIAFINGDAYGGGVELMMAFDFILSDPKVKFGFTQGRFFLSPGWGGLTRLIEKVGRSKALEWQGRADVKGAKEMLEEKFINHICKKEHVLDWTTPLTKNDRDFIKSLKRSSQQHSEIRQNAMRAEIDPFAELWIDDQHISRVEEFMNKNK